MKSTILALATILSFVGLSSAQTQLPFKTDTTATAKLGFNKQNHWLLPLKDSVVIKGFDFCIPKNVDSNLATSFYNMPVIVPNGKQTMPVHTPDTTVNYKKRVFSID